MTSEANLRQIAAKMTALAQDAWEEDADGTLRVDLESPQFGLCRFREDLTTLAEREGYSVRETRVRPRGGRERRYLEMSKR